MLLPLLGSRACTSLQVRVRAHRVNGRVQARLQDAGRAKTSLCGGILLDISRFLRSGGELSDSSSFKPRFKLGTGVSHVFLPHLPRVQQDS